MIIQVEPDLEGMAQTVALVYDVGEARPFRVELSTSHRCIAADLYNVGVALSEVLVPTELRRIVGAR